MTAAALVLGVLHFDGDPAAAQGRPIQIDVHQCFEPGEFLGDLAVCIDQTGFVHTVQTPSGNVIFISDVCTHQRATLHGMFYSDVLICDRVQSLTMEEMFQVFHRKTSFDYRDTEQECHIETHSHFVGDRIQFDRLVGGCTPV